MLQWKNIAYAGETNRHYIWFKQLQLVHIQIQYSIKTLIERDGMEWDWIGLDKPINSVIVEQQCLKLSILSLTQHY